MSEFDEAVIQRIKQLEREVERLQKWERAADLGLGKLSDPNADRVLFWDESAGALKWLTVSTGLALSDTSLALSHLGLQSLTDPGADRVLFWDDSAGALKWLTLGTGLTITDTTIKPSQPQFYPLTTPKTSTSWDGDARSTTAKTKIDLSDVFGVPAGVKAILVRITARDSGGSSGYCQFALSPNNTAGSVAIQAYLQGVANDVYVSENGIVPCDANGDVYYQIIASGTETLEAFIEIWGWWL